MCECAHWGRFSSRWFEKVGHPRGLYIFSMSTTNSKAGKRSRMGNSSTWMVDLVANMSLREVAEVVLQNASKATRSLVVVLVDFRTAW